jgi:UDPglucose 6-dehydrogenase
MKIAVIGIGYVGLSNAILLSQHHEVVAVDVSPERVNMINSRISPLVDPEVQQYLKEKELNLTATTDITTALAQADYAIVSTPTNYDAKLNFFDTSTVETVIKQITEISPDTTIIIKSTIPVGFTQDARKEFGNENIIFSPEFLREGRALYDNLYPSRIVVGEESPRAQKFAELLSEGALLRSQTIYS